MPLLVRLLACAAFLAPLHTARAQAPREVPYQGVLLDNGTPITEPTQVVFRLYTTLNGASDVWAEPQTLTPDGEGRFATRLGEVIELPVFAQPLWLSLTVDGTPVGPRTELGAAPYALGLYGVRVAPAPDIVDAPSISAGYFENEAGPSAVVSGGGTVSAPNRAPGVMSAVGGGKGNTADDFYATVGGGEDNTADGFATVVGGGLDNVARNLFATVLGGRSNRATGFQSTVAGGDSNHARGRNSFAAGFNARAAHDGSFVWSDDSRPAADSLVTTRVRQFLIRAAGGVGINTNAPADGQLRVVNTADRGDISATVRAQNDNAGDAYAGYFRSAGSSTTLAAEATGSGAILRGLASGDLRFEVQNDGDVTADGTFTGGGADLAEFFSLDGDAAVAPGQVVGLRGGLVSLATEGAEQVAVISSNPAFVGNPDAADGGALVALVGQVEVQVSGDASAGDLLIASGAADGRARAVAVAAYTLTDGSVLGRVLTVEGERVVALVGVDEAAALRGVIERQTDEFSRQGEQIDALVERMSRLEAGLAPAP